MDDEVIWKILKSLTLPFKIVAQMIQLMIPCTENFTKETLLYRLEVVELDLKQSGELASVETSFNALKVKSGQTRNKSAQNDSASSSKIVDETIKEGVALLIEREVDGKKIFKC